MEFSALFKDSLLLPFVQIQFHVQNHHQNKKNDVTIAAVVVVVVVVDDG